MSTSTLARRSDRSALPILLLLALAIGAGVFLRVRHLQRELLTRWQVVLNGGAITTQRTVGEWVGERKADAAALASSLSVHADLREDSGSSTETFAQVLAPVTRRGKFVAIWVLDSAGRVVAQSTPDSLREEERSAARGARSANGVVHSAVMALGPHAAFLSFAAPINLGASASSAGPRPTTIVLRTDIIAAFSPWAAGRPNAAMSLLSTPSPEGTVLITACPEQTVPVCIAREPRLRPDAPAALALARTDTFGLFYGVEGTRILASTRYDASLGWGIVRRVRYNTAVVPLWTEIAIEGGFLAVLLALVGVGAYAANRNVRVKRLSAQREAAGRLAVVLDASTDGIISLDANLTIGMVNGAVERLLGYSREALVGRSVLSLFTTRWHAPLSESLRAFGRAGESHTPLADTERCVAICADGRQLLVDARIGRAMVEGVPLFVMGLRDVSERARTEAFLQGQRQVLEMVATGSPPHETMAALLGVLEREASQLRSAVYELDDEWQIARLVAARSLPAAFTEEFGEIVVGPGDDGGVVASAIFRRETILSPDVSSDAVWGDQRAFVVEHGIRGAWAIPLRTAGGRVIGALACFYDDARDATPRERELARAVVHLASIALSSAREAGSLRASERRRSRAIVRDMLSFVRQGELSSEPLLVSAVVSMTARALRPTLDAAGVSMQVDGGDTAAVTLADRSGLEQIVTNLVMNAAQAAGRGGQVWIVVRAVERGCEIAVEDSGEGIPDDVRPHIFDPYFTTKPTGEGTGLGLSVTLGMVEQFGGRIFVDPTVAGRGARFTVFLPCIDPGTMTSREDAPIEHTAAAPVTEAVPKVALIIDDEPTIRAALRRYFTRRGWAVEEAADGAAGLALIESHGNDFGVIISDLRMPGFSGIELHDRLARGHPEMLRRFVFSTGDVASGEAASFVQRTTCPVLQKPFELRMLDSIIARVTQQGTPAERVIT